MTYNTSFYNTRMLYRASREQESIEKQTARSQIVSPWAPVGAEKSMILKRFLIIASGYSRGDFDTQVTYLQEQINALVASNDALTNQVYYSGDTDNIAYTNNLISSS